MERGDAGKLVMWLAAWVVVWGVGVVLWYTLPRVIVLVAQ